VHRILSVLEEVWAGRRSEAVAASHPSTLCAADLGAVTGAGLLDELSFGYAAAVLKPSPRRYPIRPPSAR
jgi:hypothetical protein